MFNIPYIQQTSLYLLFKLDSNLKDCGKMEHQKGMSSSAMTITCRCNKIVKTEKVHKFSTNL